LGRLFMMKVRCPVFISAALLLVAAGPALADDPPSRVGRISYVTGSVSYNPAAVDDDEGWAPASVNYPLTTGDQLWTDSDGRAELSTGRAAVRLAPETSVAVLTLDDDTTQLRLAEGSLSLGVRRLDEGDAIEVDTPNGAVTIEGPGEYRIDVDRDGERTTVTAREGDAKVASNGSTLPVRSGDELTISGIDSPTYDVRGARDEDDWDLWCRSRDRAQERSASARYVSGEMIGYADLDENGTWSEDRDYGMVWAPTRVAADWAPYRYGHWAFVPPWGWTWVDDAPWGFAPFHYGRWAYSGRRWVWAPGRIVARPVYAPALVAWVGGNGWQASLSLGGGGVAWFPLGPRETYVPPYAVSEGYARRVNITHATDIHRGHTTYVNERLVGAVTVVPTETFERCRPVGHARVVVSPRAFERFEVTTAPERVAPRRQSIIGDERAHAIRRPPEAISRRIVVVRRTPIAPAHSPIAPDDRRGLRQEVHALVKPVTPPPGSERHAPRPIEPRVRAPEPVEAQPHRREERPPTPVAPVPAHEDDQQGPRPRQHQPARRAEPTPVTGSTPQPPVRMAPHPPRPVEPDVKVEPPPATHHHAEPPPKAEERHPHPQSTPTVAPRPTPRPAASPHAKATEARKKDKKEEEKDH
jgi:Family of unknown function (DUF6600)/FecR protein